MQIRIVLVSAHEFKTSLKLFVQKTGINGLILFQFLTEVWILTDQRIQRMCELFYPI